jgi:hypothetical protein
MSAAIGCVGLGQHAGERRERLVQPQVVPPAHGDQVAEPHVRHLVQQRLGAPLVGVAGDAAAEDVVLEERHGAGVLHRARVELGHEQLVVLGERVGRAEIPVVEAEALLGLGEEAVGVHVLGQRRAAVDAERDGLVVVGVLVTPLGVRAGDQRDQVGGEPLGLLEHRPDGAFRRLFAGLHHRVRDDFPVLRRDDREAVDRLQVGLVEAGEHPLGVRRLELRVQVDAVVDRVDEPVQAFAGVHVPAVGAHRELVRLGQSGQRDALVLDVRADVDVRAVQGGRVHAVGDEVDPRPLTATGAGEPYGRRRGEGLLPGTAVAVGQVELDVVAGDIEQVRAQFGLVAGQVGGGHRHLWSWDRFSTPRIQSWGRGGGR